MAVVSKYEPIAQEFLGAHPIGTVLDGSELQDWVAGHSDGAVIKPDLAIGDPSKRIAALRRHLNDGGRSRNLAEDHRFVLAVEDAKAKTFIVRSHAEVAKENAKEAIGKSVYSALRPLKNGKRAVDQVKLDELPDIDRKALEMARDNVAAMEAAMKPTLAQEVDRIWIAEMARRGIPADIALKIREALPEMTKVQKLLRATA